MIIQIWDKAKTNELAVLKDDAEDPELKFEDLDFKNNLWGHFSCTFTVKRETGDYWEDLEDSNIVYVLNDDGVICWYGDIEGVERVDDTEKKFQVECVGPSAKVKNMGTKHDSPDLDPGETGSTYLTDHMLTDSDLGYTEGEIDINDFEITTGIQFSPGKSYEQIINSVNEYNGYRPQVWEDNKFYWLPKETTPTYFVNKKDCETTSINRNRRGIINWVQVSYTVDGEIFDYVIAFDQASIDSHGKRCQWLAIVGTEEAEAQKVADTVIDLFSQMKPSSALTTDLIEDMYGNPVDPGEVRSGRVLHVRSLLEAEETIASSQTINESNTWEIAEVGWKDKRVTLSPGTEDETVDVMLKQLEMKNTI